MIDDLLSTKFSPPSDRNRDIYRSRLMRVLRHSSTSKLRVIHASAGYGKTSFLVQWRKELSSAKTKVAWLTVDVDDNSPATFIAYLVAAIEKADVPLSSTRLIVGDDLRDIPPKSIAISLINEIAEFGKEVHVLIDDYDVIDSSETHSLLSFLVTRAAENLRFTVAARSVPQLELADLAAKNDVTTITAADLRMSVEEANKLFANDTVSITASDLRMLVERTEGWVIALKLANLWMARRNLSAENIGKFSGRVAELADYLAEQVFESTSEDVQELMLFTSILNRVNGDIANALCARTDCWDILQTVERQELLLYAVDDERRWYRYHKLFAEFLRATLERKHPSRVANLHSIAANWYLENGELSEAIRHSTISGDTDAVAAKLEFDGGWLLYLRGQYSLMVLANERIARDVIEKYPRMFLFRIYWFLKQGNYDTAREEFETMRNRSDNFAIWRHDDGRRLHSELELMHYLIAGYEDRIFFSSDVKAIEELTESIPRKEPILRAAANNILCLLHLQAGVLDECIAVCHSAITNYRRAKSVYMESFIYFHEGKALLMQGRLRDTELIYSENDLLVKKHFGVDSDLALIESVYKAELLYLQNRTKEAAELIQVPLARLGHSDAWFDVYQTTFAIAAATARADGDIRATDDTLGRAEEFANEYAMPRISAFVQVQRINNCIWAGRRTDAIALTREYEIAGKCLSYDKNDISTRRVYTARRTVLARLDIDNGDFESAQEHLDGIQQELQSLGSHYGDLERVLLKAICLHRQQETTDAMTVIESAVSRAVFEGLKRPFIDEGHLIAPLLLEYEKHSQSSGSNRLRDAFLKEIIATLEFESKLLARESSILTSRQVEVLSYAREGYSNKEIARKTDIRENTVKFHLKNAYKILNTNSRRAAIEEAIRRELI